MNKPFCASNKMLEQKWRDMAYQRHLDKLKKIKPQIRQEFTKNREEENYKIQRRIMRDLAEERRQEMIAKENHKLLMSILNIMAKPSQVDSWNFDYITYTNTRRGLPNKVPPLALERIKERLKESLKAREENVKKSNDGAEDESERPGENDNESTTELPEEKAEELELPKEKLKESTKKSSEETTKKSSTVLPPIVG